MRTHLTSALLILLLTAGAVAPAGAAEVPAPPAIQQPETPSMSQAPDVSRPPPAPVAPVELNGVIYAEDMSQSGGILKATDAKSKEVLWTLKVYDVNGDPNAPAGMMEIYFTSIVAGPGPNELQITNESGFTYSVDVTARSVKLVSSPAPKPKFSVPG